jgi:outer membrane protein assembly factor BamE (lipoprotein component of BamABCDE complex)
MTLRWDMMNDLRNRYKLVGMTKRQIIDLLGNGGNLTSSEFRYYLGYSKTGINTGSLIITFNDKDIVTEIKVWQG